MVRAWKNADSAGALLFLAIAAPWYIMMYLAHGEDFVNRTARVVIRKGRELQLSRQEFQMLDLLVQNRGQVVPRQILLERVWGLESEVTPTIWRHMSVFCGKRLTIQMKPH